MALKICLLCDSLASGGAEKVVANLSKSLTNRGYKVTIVTMLDYIVYSYSGDLYNFGIIKNKYNRWKAFKVFKAYFRYQDFNIIIDHRVRNKFFKELIFSKFVFNRSNLVYCIHNYDLSYSFAHFKNRFLSKIQHVSKARFVSVSKRIQQKLKTKLNIDSSVIYNFVDVDYINNLSHQHNPEIKNNYIIGVGRLTKIKQFNVLIEAYANSTLPSKSVHLVILGEGPERQNLQEIILRKNLESIVTVLPFQSNPYNFIANAKALILSSKVEGFPMVILEALFLKTPVISYDCNSGPAEMIDHKVNGILVENQNTKALTVALDTFILHPENYDNPSHKLQFFQENTIINQWITLLETDNRV